jgi:1-acyl-sn-glycerol-3-phosphate acyltransferase
MSARQVGVGRKLLSALFWFYLMSASALLFLPALTIFIVTFPFDRQRRLLHRYTCWWAFHFIELSPLWGVEFEGRERIPPGPALLCPNHQSLADVLMLFGLKRHFKWVSKRALFRLPFIGWNMRLNDYVGLRRGDTQSIAEMMEHCRGHLRSGSAVMIFPEGSRSMDGQIRPFKHGAFTLAVESELPIVPIIVEGTHDILPKSGWVFTHGRRVLVRVKVLEPVASAGRDAGELRRELQARMSRELSDMRERKAREPSAR